MAGNGLGALRSRVQGRYDPSDYPALYRQAVRWARDRPLAGVRVLDGSPVFENTLARYLPLLAAGAELTVSIASGLPHDPHVFGQLPGYGIRVIGTVDEAGAFDVVLDCAGHHAAVPSRFGYVELTRSGERAYRDCPQPVLLADAGRVKVIETELGTGDGFVRAMQHFGHGHLSGRSIVVFGAGKVGRGVAVRARAVGAEVTLVDRDPAVRVPAGCEVVPAGEPGRWHPLVEQAWCVVTATGVPGAMAGHVDLLRGSGALLVNMGAEDEYGPAMPPGRVLNGKAPANFALDEPTHLRYIDPTLALEHAAALELLAGRLPPGVNLPSPGLEEPILQAVRDHGAIAGELAGLESSRS